ncbi:zf-HC2 domain-containing protein [Alkalicoccus urumqiensis]|uniref:Anti-sigma-W factor RsiW n=1 Tax=Alkalicoccus urumqiensis TaxID=1548213 RepID=A0A2P6MLN6_ALKUR|nr:zf-HC2 domain-containing protein [Alkalicoccus urumqiensis]PRO67160.1 anti-sigma factor [Alkalicoccus urumqiensis]
MACSREQRTLIDTYLDEEMTTREAEQLERHLQECPECRSYVDECSTAVARLRSMARLEAPAGFTDQVMKSLPKQPKRRQWKTWIRRHPMVITAATFFLVFLISLSSVMGGEETVSVEGSGQYLIDESQNMVVVPEDAVVEGDLVVRNGSVEVNGEVTGDVVIINGQHLQASTARISGEIEEIDESMEWLWYEIKDFMKDAFSFSGNGTENEDSR